MTTTPASTAIVVTIPRNIRFRMLTVGYLKSDVSGGTNEVIGRSVAPQFLQKREPVVAEPHCGQIDVWAAPSIEQHHTLAADG